jgi:hypothetical protein
MANTVNELRKTRACNNTELHTLKSCNCYATDDATAMQPEAVKAKALAVLRRNNERNSHATAEKVLCNNQCNNQPKVAQKVASIAEQRMQLMATDFARFCLAHQNTFKSGHCPVKNDKRDPLSSCIGWQMKNGKRLH